MPQPESLKFSILICDHGNVKWLYCSGAPVGEVRADQFFPRKTITASVVVEIKLSQIANFNGPEDFNALADYLEKIAAALRNPATGEHNP